MRSRASTHAVLVLCAVISPIYLGNSSAQAAVTWGSDSQNAYSANNCVYGDRPGNNYVNNLYNQLTTPQGISGFSTPVAVSGGTLFYDSNAWASDITGSFADSQSIFVWAGHGQGVKDNSAHNLSGAGAHFFTTNSSTPHPVTSNTPGGDAGHYVPEANAVWNQISLGTNQNRWSIFYTCRFLQDYSDANNQTAIKNMFKGTHMIMGFASRMYMDSREATTLGTYLRTAGQSTSTWKGAFFAAAEQYQPQLDPSCNVNSKTVARIYGWTSNINNDTPYSYSGSAGSWSPSSDYLFSIVSDEIADTGNSGPCGSP